MISAGQISRFKLNYGFDGHAVKILEFLTRSVCISLYKMGFKYRKFSGRLPAASLSRQVSTKIGFNAPVRKMTPPPWGRGSKTFIREIPVSGALRLKAVSNC